MDFIPDWEIKDDTFYIAITNGIIRSEGVEEIEDVEDDDEGNEVVSYSEQEFFEIIEPDRYLIKTVEEAIRKDNDLVKGRGLAVYINNERLEADVDSIVFDRLEVTGQDKNRINTIFKVRVSPDREMDDDELIEAVGEYLIGQCSDGWGEGFEQWPVLENDTYYYSERGDIYFSPWQPESVWELRENEELYENNSSRKNSFASKMYERRHFTDYVKHELSKH